LSEELLSDVLFDADRDLKNRTPLLEGNQGRDLVPARILGCQLDVEDGHATAPK